MVTLTNLSRIVPITAAINAITNSVETTMTFADKTVILLASDLILQSTVSRFAEQCATKFVVTTDVSSVTESLSNHAALLLIDLGLPALQLADMTAQIPEEVLARAVAYGPHVHTEKLEAARAAGIGSVMSRGQFSARVGQLIAEFAAASEDS